MKKIVCLLICLTVTAAVLSACGCEHTWVEANCDTPKTCSQCGETEGAPLGHVWKAATCTDAKTCEVCQKTGGQALGHKWTEAECETPKTCENCNKTEGKALGHTWKEATTEAPKTCQTCLAIEGTAIQTDKRFTTAACKDLFGSWVCNYKVDGEAELGMTIDGEDLDYEMIMTFTFNNDGTGTMEARPEKESYIRVVRIVSVEQTYQELEKEGLTRDQADAAMIQVYGMDVEAYVDAAMAQLDISQFSVSVDLVYYVQDGMLYDASGWNDTFDSSVFSVEGDTLLLEGEVSGEKMQLKFTKQP